MSIVVNVLLFLHLLGVVLGVGAGLAMSRISPLGAQANDDQKNVLFQAGKLLFGYRHMGLGILWITGPLLVWLKYGTLSGLSHWFWLKMVLVLVLSAAIGMGSKAHRQLREGDASVTPKLKIIGQVGTWSALGVIFSAAFAFG